MSVLERVLEPEVMDTVQDAIEYDAMGNAEVNKIFVQDFLYVYRKSSDRELHMCERILDVGTGTALIPIELCQEHATCEILGIDLANEMLKLAERNIALANMSSRIQVACIDAKNLPYQECSFAAVMSNSIMHHLPDPTSCFAEMCRVLSADGILFIRDLARPHDELALKELVQNHAGNESPYSQQLFHQSLVAAFTIPEIHKMIAGLPIKIHSLSMSSNRHWTLVAQKT